MYYQIRIRQKIIFSYSLGRIYIGLYPFSIFIYKMQSISFNYKLNSLRFAFKNYHQIFIDAELESPFKWHLNLFFINILYSQYKFKNNAENQII